MSKFLKVGGFYINMDNVVQVWGFGDELNIEFAVAAADGEHNLVTQTMVNPDNCAALLRWLDANSETLPGDGAADEQDEQRRNEEAARLRLTYPS